VGIVALTILAAAAKAQPDFGSIIRSIVISIGVPAAIAAGVARIVADRMAAKTNARYARDLEQVKNEYNRENEQLKNQYNVEIERMRADIGDRRDALNSALNAVSSGYGAAQQRIIEATDTLWSRVLDMRRFASSSLFFYSYLSPDEYQSIFTNPKAKPFFVAIPPDIFTERMSSFQDGLENLRPFLSDDLWLFFTVYYIFLTRVGRKVQQGYAKGQLYSWNLGVDGKIDEGTINALRAALTKEELDVFLKETTAKRVTIENIGVPQRIMSTMDQKILAEIDKLIFGRTLITKNFQERELAQKLLQASLVENASLSVTTAVS